MTKEQFESFVQEASKVLAMDSSHDAVRSKLQGSISGQYRMDNPGADYYNTPYVQDVFGDDESGQVVHSSGGKTTMSDYKKNANGGYDVKNHRPVKRAYVADTADTKGKTMKESLSYNGLPTLLEFVEESTKDTDLVFVQEAANTPALIKLIDEGAGSSGFYSEQVLKKAVEDGVFSSDSRMFFDHQTAQERAARPEGEVGKWAATFAGKAKWMDKTSAPDGAGVYVPANIYDDVKPFIEARKKDIGVSIRAGVTTTGKMIEGVPEVKEMKYLLSADFVTKAGRGGKLVEMYESFRSQAGNTRVDPADRSNMTAEEQRKFDLLQESATKALTRLDRLEDENNKLKAANLVSEALQGTGFLPRECARVSKLVLTKLPLNDGVLDIVKFQESVKTAIAEETAYLQENGIVRTPFRVRGMGNTQPLQDSELKAEEKLLEESKKNLDDSLGSILGREPKKEKAA